MPSNKIVYLAAVALLAVAPRLARRAGAAELCLHLTQRWLLIGALGRQGGRHFQEAWSRRQRDLH